MNEAFFLFLDEKYPESQGVVDSYIELYKNDSNLPYLYFLKASSFQKRRKSPTKEYYLIQTNIDSWNDVVLHDTGLYMAEAKFRIAELEEMQCLHELRIGDIYMNRKDYFAALRRFNNVLHCKTDKYYVEASKRLVKIYKKIDMLEQAEKYQDILDSHSDYKMPDELGLKQSIKNFLFDMIPDFGFLPNWMRIAS
jgi:outer membrane protein assembly factor BamD